MKLNKGKYSQLIVEPTNQQEIMLLFRTNGSQEVRLINTESKTLKDIQRLVGTFVIKNCLNIQLEGSNNAVHQSDETNEPRPSAEPNTETRE
jgi:hypothetical protein